MSPFSLKRGINDSLGIKAVIVTLNYKVTQPKSKMADGRHFGTLVELC